MYKVTEQGIERSIPTLDEIKQGYEMVIPKEIFIEAYIRYVEPLINKVTE